MFFHYRSISQLATGARSKCPGRFCGPQSEPFVFLHRLNFKPFNHRAKHRGVPEFPIEPDRLTLSHGGPDEPPPIFARYARRSLRPSAREASGLREPVWGRSCELRSPSASRETAPRRSPRSRRRLRRTVFGHARGSAWADVICDRRDAACAVH